MKIVIAALFLIVPVFASAQAKFKLNPRPRAEIQKLNLPPAQTNRLTDTHCSQAVRDLCGKAPDIAGCVQLNKKKLDEYCVASASPERSEPKAEASSGKMFSFGIAGGAGKTREIKGGFPDGDHDYFAVRGKAQGSFWMINPNFTFYKVGKDKPSVRTINFSAYIGPVVAHELTYRDQGRTHFERIMGGLGKDFRFTENTHVIASIGAAHFGSDPGTVKVTRTGTKRVDQKDDSGGYVGADFETKVWLLNFRIRQSLAYVKSHTFPNTLAHVDLMPISLWKLNIGPELEYVDSRVVKFQEQIIRAGVAINY